MSRAVAPIVRRSFTANSEETGSLPAWWSATVTIVTAPASHLTHPSRLLPPPLPPAPWPAQLAIALAAGSLLATTGLWLAGGGLVDLVTALFTPFAPADRAGGRRPAASVPTRDVSAEPARRRQLPAGIQRRGCRRGCGPGDGRHRYGSVQVRLTVTGGKITAARAVQAPDGNSRRVNAYALSIPDRQAVTAQSAHIDGVPGATSWPASVRMLRCSSIRTAPPP